MVTRGRHPQVRPSDGYGVCAVPQPLLSYHALNPEPTWFLSHPFINRGFLSLNSKNGSSVTVGSLASKKSARHPRLHRRGTLA